METELLSMRRTIFLSFNTKLVAITCLFWLSLISWVPGETRDHLIQDINVDLASAKSRKQALVVLFLKKSSPKAKSLESVLATQKVGVFLLKHCAFAEYDSADPYGAQLMKDYHIARIPCLVAISTNGKVLGIDPEVPADPDQLIAHIKRLIKKRG